MQRSDEQLGLVRSAGFTATSSLTNGMIEMYPLTWKPKLDPI